ncbi:M50 family metallopeptidase [Mycolicibacterium holsaticum]|uniref:M50 family metallopeptidase n=1 Tax=Mycolicibacterium holsaticum TaxID=152142 RepID=UPI001C7CA6C2|nr:M50 family metallopeptidase [Mycolicibacterium holsaticum]MDA4108170.1 hypothetical protein [Mycolicibacterium holsaticum DSM 44478 = JCM 12374]QZA14421.1 M50 family metallopeptidase [Mycolicibacterium holsaticum DSM 44478 = JCM 12374]UNC08129.1 M50 family metallopeptidase [Mycolicibacterium holsaticum DSM 44478 = JCM 12374]
MSNGHRLTQAELSRLSTAFHEAGHAVAAVVLGGRVHGSVLDDEHPHTEFDTLPAGTDPAVSLAGPWCEARWTLGRSPGPADNRRILAAHTSDDRALCAAGGWAAGASVVPLLERCWPAVKAVTSRLYFHGRAEHADVCAALGLTDDGGPASLGLAMIRSGAAPGAFTITKPVAANVGSPFRSVDRINLDG